MSTPQIPTSINPIDALRALRKCFADNGVQLIKPEASQFRPVDDTERAISILEAVDIVLRASEK